MGIMEIKKNLKKDRTFIDELILHAYLFSLALCLKSSTAFRKSVTLNRPLSLSSNSNLQRERETRLVSIAS